MDFKTTITDVQPQTVAILHHWDTDGLASAALFAAYIQEQSPKTVLQFFHPTINNYFLTPHEYTEIEQCAPDVLIVTDLNFAVDVIEQLEQQHAQVFVFDHHSQTADIQRPGKQDSSYPGCSYLVAEYLQSPLQLVGVLGMVGDQEEKLKDNDQYYQIVEQVMKEQEISFDELLRITKLMDTAYVVGDTESFVGIIQLLQQDPKVLLTHSGLLQNEERIKKEMEKELATELKEHGSRVLFHSIASDFSLISEITRALARQHPEQIIVTEQERGDDSSLYVRRRDSDYDCGAVVQLARERGYNAGGKAEVAGIVLPTSDLQKFRDELIDFIVQAYE